MREQRREHRFSGNVDSDPRGIAGDPPAAPTFRTEDRDTRAARDVQNQVSRVGRHMYAALNNLLGCLHRITLATRALCIAPKVRDFQIWEVLEVEDILETVPGGFEPMLCDKALHANRVCFPT